MVQAIIEVKDLEFGYDKIPILDHIDLLVAENEFIGIFGPNGGGKTTFLKLLLGFLVPRKGIVHILGKPPKFSRSSIGYVPQLARFDKQFPISVLDLVLMGCLSKVSWWGKMPNEMKARAKEALCKVGLGDKWALPFGTLSGGQAQRALIARAIVSNPALLLLDEPTASVDPEAELEILNLLNSLKSSMTILMVTHDLQTILSKTQRFLCIHHGLTSYRPEDLCNHFALGLYHPPLPQVSKEV
ncbi:MAG: metal ABC transporter ATP-binding protein [Anaerolineae bacterium]